MNKNLKPCFYCYLLERLAVNKLRGKKMNGRYKHKAGFYLILSRSFTKRDKYACSALNHNHNNNLIIDYRIFFKNSKKKRMAVYKVRGCQYE